MGPGYGMMRGFGAFGWFGWVFQIIVLVAVIYLVIYAVRAFSTSNKHRSVSSNESALNILAERFARGEISAEEYKSMKDQVVK